MDVSMTAFIIIITIVVVLCLVILAILFYLLRVKRLTRKNQSYPVNEPTTSHNNSRRKSQSQNVNNISQSDHISLSSNNIQLKNYRRFYDEPMVVVGDENASGSDRKRPTSFRNEAYAMSDDIVDDQLSITYLPDDYFALELDRSQRILTNSRRNLISEQVLANSLSHHKLRRELAEVIAKDKVVENTVTFTGAPTIYDDIGSVDNQPTTFLRERSTNSSYKSDATNDLEVVFRERTAV